MAKEVDLLSYWMPVLRNLKEFKEIAKAEEPELRYILEAIERSLNNMYIELADEVGISRFEKMLGIVPEATDTLDLRRVRVLTKWGDTTIYTSDSVKNIASLYCRDKPAQITEFVDDYNVAVATNIYTNGGVEAVYELLRKIIPANITLSVRNFTSEIATTAVHTAGLMSTNTAYDIPAKTEGVVLKDIADVPLRSGVASSVGTKVTIYTSDTTR